MNRTLAMETQTNKNMKKYILYILLCIGIFSCKEDTLELYDSTQKSLNFAKTLTDKNGSALEIFGPEEDIRKSILSMLIF